MGKWLDVLTVSVVVAGTLMPVGIAYAQDTGSSDDVDGSGRITDDGSATDRRYGLLNANGDILRIDREAGTVSFCQKENQTWRCVPAPLAEEAYIAEINALYGEVDRLTARLEELQDDGDQKESEIDGISKAPSSEGVAPPEDMARAPETKTIPSPSLSEEDEAQLDKMLQFSEKAMRRFLGLMRDLRTEFDGEKGG